MRAFTAENAVARADLRFEQASDCVELAQRWREQAENETGDTARTMLGYASIKEADAAHHRKQAERYQALAQGGTHG